MNTGAGSPATGRVGDVGQTAIVRGGTGNDILTFGVRRLGGAATAVTAQVIGDAGNDQGRRTNATVNGDPSNETDTSIV